MRAYSAETTSWWILRNSLRPVPDSRVRPRGRPMRTDDVVLEAPNGQLGSLADSADGTPRGNLLEKLAT